MLSYKRSSALFQAAQQVLPGGVNSPVRAFNSVGGSPVFVERAQGAYLYDADSNKLIDYIASWGPLLFGHAYARQMLGLSCGFVGGLFDLPFVLCVFFATGQNGVHAAHVLNNLVCIPDRFIA